MTIAAFNAEGRAVQLFGGCRASIALNSLQVPDGCVLRDLTGTPFEGVSLFGLPDLAALDQALAAGGHPVGDPDLTEAFGELAVRAWLNGQ